MDKEISTQTDKKQWTLYGVMCRTLSNTFFKYGINVFDSRLKKYGGFNHFFAGTIFRWRYHYLTIYLKKEFKIERIHKDDNYYYDGYHNSLWLGWVLISYGT